MLTRIQPSCFEQCFLFVLPAERVQITGLLAGLSAVTTYLPSVMCFAKIINKIY